MTRSIIIAAIAGFSIGAIGYDAEIIARGEATVWELPACGCGGHRIDGCLVVYAPTSQMGQAPVVNFLVASFAIALQRMRAQV